METKSKLMVIQGPNINMLGTRETDVYGSMKMEDIHGQMKLFAEQNGIEIEFFQSNFEGELVDKIQECFGEFDGIIINPAAYTHTSIAIRDAIAAVGLPVIEARELCKDTEVIEVERNLIKDARLFLRKAGVRELSYNPYDFSAGEWETLSKGLGIRFKARANFSQISRIVN